MYTIIKSKLFNWATLTVVFVFGLLLVGPAFAAEGESLRLLLDEPTIARGYTLELPSVDLRLAVFPNVLDRPALITIRQSDETGTVAPEGLTRVSPVFEFDIKTDPIRIFGKEVIVVVRYDSDQTARHRVRYWDSNKNEWIPLYSLDNRTNQTVRAYTHLPYSKIAVFEEPGVVEGVASWYRSTKTLTAASNDFDLGSCLKVTNLDDNRSVTVTVASRGPYVSGRVIDLSSDAFKAISSISEGVIHVRVELIEGGAGPTESQPSADGPTVTAASALVWDPTDGRVLTDKNASIRPIASLTKLMTALVFLETNPDFDAVVEYQADDEAIGSRLSITPGETLTVRNLFYCSLIGSANNATKALARSTGLTKDEFVRRMNNVARRLGMTETTYTEPTGLESSNQSSTRDLAKLINYIMQRPGVQQATIQPVYEFTTLNSARFHRIKNTNTLLDDDLPIFGGKTGYIDESGYNLGLKLKTTDRQRVVIILGSSSLWSRDNDMLKLGRWAMEQA